MAFTLKASGGLRELLSTWDECPVVPDRDLRGIGAAVTLTDVVRAQEIASPQ